MQLLKAYLLPVNGINPRAKRERGFEAADSTAKEEQHIV
jgi:hypothetical protein